MQNLTERALGKYVIVEEIGRGGMGAVYKARDAELDRVVAMKILSPYLVGEPRLVQRFIREARMAANLDHPNIVTIYDIGGEGGYYYFVMKYLEGRSLKELLAERAPMSLQEVVQIVRQLASALDYAHEQNLIHRDVKPGNIIVDEEGHVTLTDFGLAKVAENLKLTASGESIGTLEYMAPEQARGDVDRRSDIYSLGVILYEMLTGRLPFQGQNQASLLYQHLHEPPPPMGDWRLDIPPEVETVVLKAMAKSPDERYASAGELAQELEEAAQKAFFPGPAPRPAVRGEVVAPRKVPQEPAPVPGETPEQPLPWWKRVLPLQWRWIAVGVVPLILVAVVLALLFGFGGVFSQAPPPPTAVPVPALVGPAHPVYLPLLWRNPSLPSQVTDAQLAMLCALEADWGGRLASWRWGQGRPILLPDLIDVPIVSQLSWSPEGNNLVYVVAQEDQPDIYRVRYDGSRLARLTSRWGEEEDPVWSPAGEEIAFVSGRQGSRDLYIIAVEGEEAREVTPAGGDDWAPAWSPDASQLAFSSDRAGNTEIFALDLASGELQQLTEHPAHDVYPSWSPDGEQIAFLSDRGGEGFRLYIMDSDGQRVQLVLDEEVMLERPSWSPQGDWLVLTRLTEEDLPQVIFFHPASGQILVGPSACRRPAWRPIPEE